MNCKNHKRGIVKIGLFGSEYHVNLLAEQINSLNGIYHAENACKNRYSLKYHIYHGIFAFLNRRYIYTKLSRKKNICHWIGTDVYQIINDRDLQKKRRLIEKYIDINIAGSENLIDELKVIGINSTRMPIVYKINDLEIHPFPDRFTVLTYIPEERHEFFNWEIILSLINNNPDIQFFILSNSGKYLPKYENVEYVKWCDDISEYFYKSTVLLRIPKHDGLSLSVLEALAYGRQVIWNYKFSFCHYTNSKIEDIQSILNEIRKNPKINTEGSIFVKKNYSVEKIVGENLFNLYDSVLTG